jgi:enamine deaminase RidA (YjgF/YER057c/UK114 family)
MDAIYREYFEEPLPARTTVGAAIRGFAVEIDAVIAIRHTS